MNANAKLVVKGALVAAAIGGTVALVSLTNDEPMPEVLPSVTVPMPGASGELGTIPDVGVLP
jgi:hypothetical protein